VVVPPHLLLLTIYREGRNCIFSADATIYLTAHRYHCIPDILSWLHFSPGTPKFERDQVDIITSMSINM